jgi:hypothetical protein
MQKHHTVCITAGSGAFYFLYFSRQKVLVTVTKVLCLQLRLKNLSDKHVRTQVHMFFKQPHPLPRLVTDTVSNSDGTVDIRVVAQADLRNAVKRHATILCCSALFCLSIPVDLD